MLRRSGLLLLLAACEVHGIPSDRSIETTFPTKGKVATLPHDFRVVTFNLHGETGHTVAHALATDPALRGADLVILEEVHGQDHCSVACEVANQLGFQAAYQPEFTDRGGTDGVAILSRAPIESAQTIPLPYFNVHINDELGRAALAATLRIDGMPVTVYAVHLTNRLTVKQRRQQMMPVIEHAEKAGTPVIIAGDFNTSPFTWLGHVIPVLTGTQDDRLEELMRAHGFQTPVKDSGATSHWLAMKLDGIYTRGFTTTRFATADALDISDHLALWAQMSLASM